MNKTMVGGTVLKDAAKGLVRAVVARVGIVDKDGDLYLPGAFGRQGVRVGTYNHRSWPHKGGEPPIGRGTIQEQGDSVIADLKFFLNTQAGREHFETVREMGDLQEWSYGYRPSQAIGAEPTTDQRRRGVSGIVYSKLTVDEVSPVLLGASVGTRTLSVDDVAVLGEAAAKEEGRALLRSTRERLANEEGKALLRAAHKTEAERTRALMAELPLPVAHSLAVALRAADGDPSRVHFASGSAAPFSGFRTGDVVISKATLRVFACNHRRTSGSWTEVRD